MFTLGEVLPTADCCCVRRTGEWLCSLVFMNSFSARGLSDPGTTGAAAALVIAAVGLAVLSILCLAAMLAINLSGGSAWAALSWIPMIGLPLAFLLMIGLVLRAVRRRRIS